MDGRTDRQISRQRLLSQKCLTVIPRPNYILKKGRIKLQQILPLRPQQVMFQTPSSPSGKAPTTGRQTGRAPTALPVTTSLAYWLRRPPRERKVPGSNPACAGIFSGSSHTSDLKIGTPVATLPGAWRYRVRVGLVGPVSVYCDWVRWKV